MSTAYAHFMNVTLYCVAVKWRGSMLVIWVCKFWKGITLVEPVGFTKMSLSNAKSVMGM